MFKCGLNISIDNNAFNIIYGDDCYGPEVEIRKLDDIRESLLDAGCTGPENVYAIAMDAGKPAYKKILNERMLLFGVVVYAAGRLGNEPVRSQGHVHKISKHSGWSPPEVYEIWNGRAVIYMQEYAADEPGRCFAVYAKEGDVVIVPPQWAHATISADAATPLVFGAWCDREYGFLYEDIKARKGLAWYALLNENNKLSWIQNKQYKYSALIEKEPENYMGLFDLEKGKPIYCQFEEDNERFQFVSKPWLKKEAWINYIP